MEFVMKRSMDNLGRIVLPIDLRRYFEINSGDTVEICVMKDGIFLKKALEQKEK